MKITVDVETAKRLFEQCDRDYYSIEGVETIIDYYDEIDENIDFDAIAICYDCSEYGEECVLSFSDLISDYEQLVIEEYAEEWYKIEDDEKVRTIIDELEHHTTVLHVPNGNYIVFDF